MLKIASLAAWGGLLMYTPTKNLKLPITEWEQALAFDTAAECETFIAMRWVKAEKENREFKLERYRCVPADVVYPLKIRCPHHLIQTKKSHRSKQVTGDG